MLIRTACWVPLLAQTLCAQGLPHGGRGNMKELSSYLEIQKAKKVKGPCFSGFERWPSISISENENTRRESFFPPVSSKATAQRSNSKNDLISKYPTLVCIHITFSKERLPYHLPRQSWSQGSLLCCESWQKQVSLDVPTIMKQSYPPGPSVNPRVFYAQIDGGL